MKIFPFGISDEISVKIAPWDNARCTKASANFWSVSKSACGKNSTAGEGGFRWCKEVPKLCSKCRVKREGNWLVLCIGKMYQNGTWNSTECFTQGNIVPKARKTIAQPVKSRYNSSETIDWREHPRTRRRGDLYEQCPAAAAGKLP